MTTEQLTRALYLFVARLDDDDHLRLYDPRLQEHAHLLRQEIKEIHPKADEWSPGRQQRGG